MKDPTDNLDAARRATAHAVVAQVVAELEPVEAELMEPFLEPLIRLADGGELVALDVSRDPGRFGSADLLTLVLVPLVVGALAWANDDTGPSEISAAEVEAMARQVGSISARKRSPEIAAALRHALAGAPARNPNPGPQHP